MRPAAPASSTGRSGRVFSWCEGVSAVESLKPLVRGPDSTWVRGSGRIREKGRVWGITRRLACWGKNRFWQSRAWKHTYRRLAIVAAAATTAALAAVPVTAASATTNTPSAPVSISAVQDGISPTLDVSWIPGAGPAATGAFVGLWAQDSSANWNFQTSSTCAGGCQSVSFPNLQPGINYWAAVWPSNSAGYGPAGASNQEVLQKCSAGVCVAVDATRAIEVAAHQAQGILHSVYPSSSEQSLLNQLGPTMWRSSYWGPQPTNTARWAMVGATQAPVTFIVSDKWYSDNNGGQITPWSNWNAYRSWVVGSVQMMQAAGLRVDYWEVYNEPDVVTTTYYPPAQAATVTADRLLTQFLITYQAIKSVIPDARIIGPSLSNWTVSSTATTFSMQQFLNFASANKLSLAALSWHYDFSEPAKIQQQVSATRSMLVSVPALGTPKIFINEYGIGETQRIPGWDVQYLAALTNAGVDSAGRECVSGDCWTPDLDGLLTPDGSAPLPDYWVHTAYGQMSGQMVSTSSSSTNVGAIASLDGNGSQISVLVGYGSGCTQDPRCAVAMPSATPAQSISTSLSVVVPWTTGTVSVSSTLISGNSITAMSQPSAVNFGTLPVTIQGGQPTVTVSLGPLADGDAMSLQLTHGS